MKKKIFSAMLILTMSISFFSGTEASATQVPTVYGRSTAAERSQILLSKERDLVINPGENTGENTVTLQGETISAPKYTVTIPEKIDFGAINRTRESKIEKRDFTVSVDNISNLFANQKKLVVTVSSSNDFNISDGKNNIKYIMYKEYTDEVNNIPLGGNLLIEKVGSIGADSNLSEVVNGSVTLDTSNIKKAGIYSDTVTFTVSLQEVN